MKTPNSRNQACLRSFFILWILLLFGALLTGCRGAEDSADREVRFPRTLDPDQFITFLNTDPGIPFLGVEAGSVDNVADFAEAYYNTIDPDSTRDTLQKWRIENGFANADGSLAECDPSNCISTNVRFRDAKDLGYGREMFLRRNLLTGSVAIYVENYQVDVVPGLPYGPLNLEALIAGERQWNFGVNAIEFSAFPNTEGLARNFTKFYNFAGDGIRALQASGLQQHSVDLDNRGNKPMPVPCIVCHGGHGRTLVYRDADNRLKIAPTITGGIAGDVQANLQMIELNTLQFADESGFTREDNAAGIQVINAAILSTFEDRQTNFNRSGDWQPDLAIELLQGRYNGDPSDTNNTYDANFVPGDWSSSDAALYQSIVGPNCMVCHVLRGSGLNSSLSFSTFAEFMAYGDRSHQLVFEQGLMPLGLLNYADFWDNPLKEPANLAVALGHMESVDANQRAIRPGSPVVQIAAPPLATGFNSGTIEVFDIPISGVDSAFVDSTSFQWHVEPDATASIEISARAGYAVLRARAAGEYTVTLSATGNQHNESASTSVIVSVSDQTQTGAIPPASNIGYYGANGIQSIVESLGCMACHTEGSGFDGIPFYFEPCQSDSINGYEFVYRSVISRVNFNSPLASLLLRKPSNGATNPRSRIDTQISGYHAGGNLLQPEANGEDRNYSMLLSWMLNGAPQGLLPLFPIAQDAPLCTP